MALSGAVRSGTFWPLPVLLGIGACAWMARCVSRRDTARLWLFLLPAGGAYAVSLLAAVDPPDAWAALAGAALLAAAELAHSAAGLPDLDVADRDTNVRYRRAAAIAVVGGFGAAELVLAAAASGGTAGPEATALGIACVCAALALLASMARPASPA